MYFRDTRRAWRSALLALAAVLIVTGATWLGWHGFRSAKRAGESALHDDVPSILVPPFRGGKAADRFWLGAGLATDVAGRLTGLQGLTVRPWTLRGPRGVLLAARQVPADDAGAVGVGTRLRATYVLVGEVERQLDRTEIAVRLLRVGDGALVWSGTYWRDFASLSAFPSELSLAVAEALHLRPSPSLNVALDPKHKRDPVAYSWYLEGLAGRADDDPTGVRHAVDLFRRATRRDPRFASAWAALAGALEIVAEQGNELSKTDSAEWRSAAEWGVSLDSLNGEAFLRRAVMRFQVDRDSTDAGTDFAGALPLIPGSADAELSYARFMDALGRRDSALAHISRALLGDPRYDEATTWLRSGKSP